MGDFVLNPFITGAPVPPDFFIGRDEIIRSFYNRLAGQVRNSIAINGEQGLGKTSLLHYIRHRAQQENWNPANIYLYIYCPDLKKFSPDQFYRHVLEKIVDQEYSDVDIQAYVKKLLDERRANYSEFRRFLRWLKKEERSLVLLLDGFTWIVRTDTANEDSIGDFLSHLRSLTNDPDYDIVLVTATREPLHELCRDIVAQRPESEFYNGFDFQTLIPFTVQEVGTLIEQALAELDIVFDDQDRDFLSQMAGTHPALLQLAGSLIFEVRRRGSLDKAVREKIVDEFDRKTRHYFEHLWQLSSPVEQTLIVLLIFSRLVDRSSIKIDLTAGEINDIFQRYERNLKSLNERGLVQATGTTYRIFSLVFARWLIGEIIVRRIAPPATTSLNEELRRVWLSFEKLAPHLTLVPSELKLVLRDPQPSEKPSFSDRYTIEEEIGKGANGTVYKGFDNKLQRRVALKLLNSQLEEPLAESTSYLLREARAASKLQHYHAVTLYEAEVSQGSIYLVMEYIEGQTIADYLKKKGPPSLELAIRWLEQCAIALDFAHQQGVIHRDVKPANLMITATGDLKVTDFGIAKVFGDPDTTHGTELKGTILYMSPEQVQQRQPLDGRSDLFSLATVAFEMLSGLSPWPGQGVQELMNNITDSPPRSLPKDTVPGAEYLEPIFQKALAKTPDDRYETCGAFVQALKQAYQASINATQGREKP